MSGYSWVVGCGVLVLLAGCTQKQRGVRPHLDNSFPEKLSEWQLFIGTAPRLRPNEGVLPYDVNTALFSNHASKSRTVWMPAGSPGTYRDTGVVELPVGTILTKTFSFGARRIETRLFVHKKKGWQGVTYVWNREQTDAVLDVTPAPVPVEWNGRRFAYDIPNVNQCKTCHEGPNDNAPLGITAKELNRDGQLAQWVRAGYLRGVPANPPVPGSDLESRARDYLDINCGSCHVVGGRGMKSGVFLNSAESDRTNLGICKPAADAPQAFDIVPGKPGQSRLLERMQSLNPKFMMPGLGHTVVDQEGVELIRQWIAAMPSTCPAA